MSPVYPYECECGKEYDILKTADKSSQAEHCNCGKLLRRLYTPPGITGTRDSFGIGRNFIHKGEDGKFREITNWKQWHKDGYRDPMDSPSISKTHKDMIKIKKKVIKDGKNRSITPMVT